MRPRRHVRRPPDLTSLFDVLFIVVFAALIRAAAVQHAAEPAPRPVGPPPPPAAVAELHQRAVAELEASIEARAPLVVRITRDATIAALEVDGRRIALDTPLLERSADPDIAVSYLGDRSAELRICRIAAVHLGAAELSRYLVIMAPAVPLDALPEALYLGLHRDLDRCMSEQRTLATLLDPSPPKGTP